LSEALNILFAGNANRIFKSLFSRWIKDFQEFELPNSDEPTLIAKICQYVGIEIREAEVYNFGATEESNDTQETS